MLANKFENECLLDLLHEKENFNNNSNEKF